MFGFVVVLALLGCANSLKTDQEVYNMLVDEVLYTADQFIVEYGLDTLSLPDVNLTLKSEHFGPWVLDGYVNSAHGTFRNTTSLKRVGDADIQLVDDKMIIGLNITIGTFDAEFEVFNFKMNLASSDGGLGVTVGTLQVSVGITVEKGDKVCAINIDKALVTDIADISLSLLPSSIWNTIKDKTFNIYINHYSDGVKQGVNERLQTIIQAVLNKIDPCSYIPF